MGLPIDPTCDLCGVAEDTDYHRHWRCTHPSVVAMRKEIVSKAVLRMVANRDEFDPCLTKGWMSHPDSAWPEPSPIYTLSATDADGRETDMAKLVMKGWVFVDGAESSTTSATARVRHGQRCKSTRRQRSWQR